jgi:hypothetical protein
MFQFLLKIWNTILEMWQLSKESRLVAEITIFLLIVLWSLHFLDSTTKLPLILIKISTQTTLLTPWLVLIAAFSIHCVERYQNKSSENLQPWKLHEKITLQIGNYYDVLNSDNKKSIRITLKEISKQMMPLPYTNIGKGTHDLIEADTATISFDDFLSILPCQAVKPILVTMPFTESLFIFSKNANSEEANSVFSFSTEGHEQFFRCYVDHINPAKQEAEIDVYFLQMKKV